eukprot:jgi/Ulvmu1/3426/UM016_0045.1
MQVADVLGDRDSGAWIDMLAQRALDAKWTDSHQANDMLCALLRLPALLLRRVLSACLASKGLDDLLAAFPLPLHPPIIAAAATTGSLQIPRHAVDTFLMLLATTPMPAPPLISLRTADASPASAFPTATAALLARALAAHPSLTSLKLDGTRLRPAWVRELSSSLSTAALPKLCELCISTDVHPSGCAELGACLKSLPALTALDVRIRFNKSPTAAAPTLATYIRSASSPAQLTSLQRLMFVELHDDDDLSGQPASHSCVHLLLPLFRAPALTYMRFASDAASISYPALLRSLVHLSSLQLLYIDAEVRQRGGPYASRAAVAAAAAYGVSCGGTAAVAAAAPAAAPAAVAALPALQKLDVKSGCAIAPLTMAATVAAHAGASFTCLSMQHLHVGRGRYAAKCSSDELAAAWDSLLLNAGLCTGLRHLELDNLCGVSGGGSEASTAAAAASREWTDALAAALTPLTALTRLSLQGVCEHCSPRMQSVLRVLRGDVFSGALRTLTGLQSLCVRSGTGHLEFEGVERVLDVLPALTQLTALGLCFHGLTLQQVSEVIPKLRAVEELQLRSDLFGQSNEEDLDSFAARFPDLNILRCGSEK